MNKHMTIKDLPENERPYEKLLKKGENSLSDAELLAIILKSGTKEERVVEMAQRLLKECGGILGLFKTSILDLQKINGIGKVKAIQIKAILELSKRIAKVGLEKDLNLDNPLSIASYYMNDLKCLQAEICKVVLIDIKSNIIKDVDIFIGYDNKTPLPIKELFRSAIKEGACGVILLHNHPSGDPNPSETDIETTNIINDAGNMLNIRLIDHIIIGGNTYISFKENNLL